MEMGLKILDLRLSIWNPDDWDGHETQIIQNLKSKILCQILAEVYRKVNVSY